MHMSKVECHQGSLVVGNSERLQWLFSSGEWFGRYMPTATEEPPEQIASNATIY